MTLPPSNSPRAAINLGLVLRALWPPLLAWAALTALFLAVDYPPILCVTPLAWVLALYTGWVCGRGAGQASGLLEAGLAGGLLGLAQGVLFGLLSALLEPGQAAEAGGALLRGLGIGLGGLTGCAVLALLAAAWSRRTV